MTETPCFSDKDRLTDALNAQKYAADHYNSFASETATPELRSCVMNILNEEHRLQAEVFDEMNSRGWYPTEKAEQQKLTDAQNRYRAGCMQC